MLDASKPSTGKFVEALPNVEMKAKEQHETIDTLIKQNLISDSFLSFSKAEKSPVQLFHWLDTFDQQNTKQGLSSSNLEVALDAKGNRQEETIRFDSKTGEGPVAKNSLHSSVKGGNMFGRGLQPSGDKFHSLKFPEAIAAFAQAAKDLPGWPLMSNKMTMHKCEKCSQEFCSPLNQRRHMRATHRRHFNGDKEDLKKKKEQIAAYWDKLIPEEAREIVSFTNPSLVDHSATALIQALSTHLQQPGPLSLPQSYIRVATALLDIVQSKPSRFPLKSEELFIILDDASEKNMLYGVTSSSMQRHIFDGEPGRVGLETKNLVASLGFLVELRLVKAWMDDKDAEALRCHKALVEEEEAAQKKRAKLQERRKQKKMRQKESKDKERKGIESSSCLQELKFDLFSREGDDSPTATQSSPSSSGYSDANPMETSQVVPLDIGSANNSKSSSSHSEDGQCHRDPDDPRELDSETGFLDQREDSRREAVHVGPPFEQGVGGGRAWKERRQVDFIYFPSQPKQAYSNDRRYYDHQYRGQRVATKSYNNIGSSNHEFSKLTTPRNSHYRSSLKNMAGNGLAVWTRKTPQTPAPLSQHDENTKLDVGEVVNDSLGTNLGMQLEHLKTDDNSGSPDLGKPEGLSRDSSLSFDSFTSQSSSSVSARVGAEEQESSEVMSVPVSCSTQIATARGEDNVGSGALVIGSVTIPLGDTLSHDREHTQWVRESVVKKSSGMDSEEEVEGVSDSLNEAVPASSGSAACVSAQGALQVVIRTSSLDAPRETSVTCRGVTPHQLAAEGDSTIQLKSHWLNALSKPGMLKVWRPVTPGEHNDSLTTAPSSEIQIFEEQRPDAANIPVVYREEGTAGLGSHASFQLQPSAYSSDKDARDPCYIGHIDYKEVAVVEGTAPASEEDVFDQQADPPGGPGYNLIPQYSDIASFLCRRWAEAISSSDAVFYGGLDDSDSVSPPLSEDNVS